jgi:hypothetical protein
MENHNAINPAIFFQIAHEAIEIVMETGPGKKQIFYHIHNPDEFTKLNFLRHMPDSRMIMMVREPVESCQSWIRLALMENDYSTIVFRITSMLFAIDHVIFRMQESIGIRLEDLKTHPQQTIRNLCKWLGIQESDTLYKMTAQGKKWWGDPSSPSYDQDKAMSPFGEFTRQPSGEFVFTEKDQFLLRTLFYPFRVKYGYENPDPVKFEANLESIREAFSDMMDFEKQISESLSIRPDEFRKSADFLLLRAGFQDRWNTLNSLRDYPGMLTPLKIN